MAHPYAGQAKSSEKSRLSRLTGKPGKAWGSSSMYKKTSYPTKNAGTQRELTISGKSSPKRADRKGQVGNFADGGAVGRFAFGGDTGGKKKRERKPAHTTNIIISHAGGRGGGGGGGGRPTTTPPAPVPVPVNRPVPVPVAAGPRPPLPPVGAAGPGPVPAGPPPVPVRPPVPPAAVGPRPPGMAAGGAVKKAAKGGFLKDSPGKSYPGFPKSPTSDKGSKVSAHADGGAVKKRAIGGGFGGMGGLAGPFAGSNQPGDPTPQAAGGLFQGPGPQRGPTPPIQGPPTLSGRPARPAMPLTVPMGATLSGRLTRPAPGLTVGYSKKGGTVGRKKGGAVHDDEAEDRKLFGKMMKEKGMQKGGVVNPGSNKPPPDLPGSIYHQQGVGMRNKGGSVGTKESTAGMSQKLPSGAAGGLARLSKTKAAKSVPAKTEA